MWKKQLIAIDMYSHCWVPSLTTNNFQPQQRELPDPNRLVSSPYPGSPEGCQPAPINYAFKPCPSSGKVKLELLAPENELKVSDDVKEVKKPSTELKYDSTLMRDIREHHCNIPLKGQQLIEPLDCRCNVCFVDAHWESITSPTDSGIGSQPPSVCGYSEKFEVSTPGPASTPDLKHTALCSEVSTGSEDSSSFPEKHDEGQRVGPQKKGPFCGKCKFHGKREPVRGHKPDCNYKKTSCKCIGCIFNDNEKLLKSQSPKVLLIYYYITIFGSVEKINEKKLKEALVLLAKAYNKAKSTEKSKRGPGPDSAKSVNKTSGDATSKISPKIPVEENKCVPYQEGEDASVEDRLFRPWLETREDSAVPHHGHPSMASPTTSVITTNSILTQPDTRRVPVLFNPLQPKPAHQHWTSPQHRCAPQPRAAHQPKPTHNPSHTHQLRPGHQRESHVHRIGEKHEDKKEKEKRIEKKVKEIEKKMEEKGNRGNQKCQFCNNHGECLRKKNHSFECKKKYNNESHWSECLPCLLTKDKQTVSKIKVKMDRAPKSVSLEEMLKADMEKDENKPFFERSQMLTQMTEEMSSLLEVTASEHATELNTVGGRKRGLEH